MIRKHLILFFASLAVILASAGCRTENYGARFDPHATSSLFTPIASTNSISPELLSRPQDLFRIGPGDVLEIKILGEAGQGSRTLVGPDGKIYFHVLPGTFVWGRTLSETTAILERALEKELRDPPRVSVILRSVGSKRFWVMGQVQAPGVYELAVPMTLLEAISLAGGFSAVPGSSEITADLKNSFVIRGDQRIPVRFDALINSGDLTQNIYLQPDDFVFLSPQRVADVFVMGAVRAPGSYPLSEGMSLTTAIALSGGLVKYAQGSQVAVLRGSISDPKIALLDWDQIKSGRGTDILLEAGDVVYVPFVPYRRLAELGDQILKTIVSSIAINEGRNAVEKNANPVGVSVGVSP